jgi:heme A synthase
LHPVLAVAVGAWLLFYAVSSASRRPDVGGRAWNLMALVGAQIVAGVLNLLLRAPVWMQLVHLLLADLLWIALVLLAATTLKFQPVP